MSSGLLYFIVPWYIIVCNMEKEVKRMGEYFTPQEVAGKLKVNIHTVYRWIREGRLAAVKVGDLWRIPESALTEFVKQKA